MRRLQLIVEGQTEETLAEHLLIPHFRELGWVVGRPMIVKTKVVNDGPDHKGGFVTWAKVRPQIQRVLASNFDLVTTVFDYYGLPDDAPGMAARTNSEDAYGSVERVERAIAEEIADRRFLPHLMLHEVEALVFAAGRELAQLLGTPGLYEATRDIVAVAGGPERVNDGPATAPSKRLVQLVPTYRKLTDGPLAVIACGLDVVRAECPHFDTWLRTIESAAPG